MKKSIDNARAREFVEELAFREGFDGLKILDHAGSVLNACWVTQNQPAVYFKFPKPTQGGGSVWDFAATACLFNEWGQPPTDIHGEPLNLNPEGSTFMNERAVVYASSPELRKAIHEFYRDLKA